MIMSMITSAIKFHLTEETIKGYPVFIHLSKIKFSFHSGPQCWEGLAGLDLNKHKFAGGKLMAKRLKVKLSQVTWLVIMHST